MDIANGVTVMPRHERGCGYRKAGATYLVGGGVMQGCQRIPMAIPICPCCGETIRPLRSVRVINAQRMFEDCVDLSHTCHEHEDNCPACFPTNKPSGLMWVGAEFYTPQGFVEEATRIGVSKRIKSLPKELSLHSYVWLAHKDAMGENGAGIFYVFQIASVQKILTAALARNQRYVDKLKAEGIEPVLEETAA